jgi:hypothetical protein
MSLAIVKNSLYENICKAYTYLRLKKVAAKLDAIPVTDWKRRSNMATEF